MTCNFPERIWVTFKMLDKVLKSLVKIQSSVSLWTLCAAKYRGERILILKSSKSSHEKRSFSKEPLLHWSTTASVTPNGFHKQLTKQSFYRSRLHFDTYSKTSAYMPVLCGWSHSQERQQSGLLAHSLQVFAYAIHESCTGTWLRYSN